MTSSREPPAEHIALTSACIEEDDVRAVARAVEARGFVEGAGTRRFESELADLLGVAGAVATTSCTAALILALRALDVRSGDEVLLPSYTCLAVANAVVQSGALPRLVDNTYDVAAMDYNISPSQLAARIGPKSRAIIVPHMFGVAAQIEEIVALGLPVIEDITLSLGARLRGRPVGSFGALAVCSFHASKMISSGEGGMLASKDGALYRRARYLNGWEGEQSALRLDDSPRFEYESRFNFHMTDLAAALGSSQLAKLPRFLERRRALAARYTARLGTVGGIHLPHSGGDDNQFFRFLVALEGRDVPTIIRRMSDENIEMGRGVYPPLHRYFEPDGQFPGADRAVASLLSIPLYPALADDQVERILDVSATVLSESR